MHDCDGCTACCKILKISELEKPANIWCRHCKVGEGCGIYETRPEVCRSYACLWLKTQSLGRPISPGLRPDKSRVVIGTTNHGEDVVFYVAPDRPDAWNRGDFRKLVAELRASSIRLHVSCGESVRQI